MIKSKSVHKTDTELLQEISSKLDDLIVLAIVQNKEKENQIKIMVEKGYPNSKIGSLLGIPKGTVDVIRAGFGKNKKE